MLSKNLNKMFKIKDKYIQVKNINGKYYGVHMFTDEILYDPYRDCVSDKLSDYSKNRIKMDVSLAIDRHNDIHRV